MPDAPILRQISRDRLFEVFKSLDLVKQFEDILYAVTTTLPDAIDGVSGDAQPKDALLTALSNLVTQANKVIYLTGVDTVAMTDFTTFGRGFVGMNTQAEGRTALGLGSISTQDASNVAITGGTVSLASGSLGYAPGNGGTVTQTTSKSTGVTLNRPSGAITMDPSALAANTAVTFTLANSTIAAGDRIVINHAAGGTFGAYACDARAAAGSATVMLRNLTGGSLSEAVVLGFAVIKGATA